ncbi:hypothetical protein CEXT_447341 [Caerostris extrusa]|uniref:Uncharacterized protein n=1 Tax=Caerostris extrusa TaxID=172846 RepID=A0AAV4TAV4_CAEEX|nr:hypothetical protein CEXT_447341 [Caerostris extrusa]
MLKGHGGFGGDFYVAVFVILRKKGVLGWGKDQKDMKIPQRFEEDVMQQHHISHLEQTEHSSFEHRRDFHRIAPTPSLSNSCSKFVYSSDNDFLRSEALSATRLASIGSTCRKFL